MPAIPIVLDNIVFSLQKAGGASVYWRQIEEGIDHDDRFNLTILERREAQANTVRQRLKISKGSTLIESNDSPLRWAQFAPVASPVPDAIFHSSCYRVSKTAGITNITTVYDFIWQHYIKGVNRAVHMAQIRHAVKRSQALICISESTRRDMEEFIPESRGRLTRVIPLAYDADSYRYVERERKPQVAFIGARTGYKNFPLAVEAASLCPDVTLVIMGAGLTDEEKAFVEERIPGRWRSLIYPSSEEVCRIFSESIALLYLSDYEGFGIPVLEGMASGVPVIAQPKSSIPEVAGAAGVLLDDVRPQSVAAAISELKENSALFSQQVSTGLERSRAFTWKRTIEETASFYKEIHEEFGV